MPINKMFYTYYKEKPDLYGPFWIYTTLVVVIAMMGNLARYIDLVIKEDSAKFEENYEFVPVAATVIYSIGFGLPLLLKLIMKFMGTGFFSSSYLEVLGIYGYSFTSFILTAFLCCIPSETIRWLLIGYSALTSTAFLMITYWNDLKENLEGKKRIIVIGIICIVQLVFFLIFKLYFFKHVVDDDNK
jgi:NADH:ubiquinone oxidoreductase subunit 5 (subunit L)/multisubunit Na+/H+ antiporter MnhA subunit